MFVSLANRDKRAAIFPVKRLSDLGFRILATAGTAQVLRRNGVHAEVVGKFSDGPGQRRRADPGRRGRPGPQHAVGLAGQLRAAARRLRDPHRRGRRRHPVPHHGAGRGRGGAGHRGAAPRRDRRPLPAGPARDLRVRRGSPRDRAALTRAGAAGRRARRCRRSASLRRAGRWAPTSSSPWPRPAIAGGPSPGQFVAVAVGGEDVGAAAAPLVRALRGDARRRRRHVRFVVAGTGRAPRWLRRSAGRATRLDLVGPLGTPVPAAATAGAPAVLVGGGYGTAPLIPLAARLRGRRLAGSTSSSAPPRADRLFGERARRAVAGAVDRDHRRRHRRPARAGHRRAADELHRADAASVVYACGPMAMLRAVGDVGAGARASRPGGGRGVDGLRDRRVHDLRAAGASATTAAPGSSGPASRGRCSTATGSAGPTSGSCRRISSAPTRWVVALMTVGHCDDVRSRRHVDLAGAVPLPNPVLTASGCSAVGRELDPFFDVSALGAVVTKSIMLRPRSGRPTPRMAETPSGMLNSIGLQGPGIDAFLAHDLPWLAERGARVVVSIAGTRVEDFAELAERLRGVPGVVGLEVNISCPNVESRGQVFACDPVAAVRRRRRGARRPPTRRSPVFAKLCPDVTDIVAVARACADAGADGLSLINTLLGLVIDPDTMRPVLGGVTGGLSGPAIRPVALRCVWQVHQALPARADPRHGRHPHRPGRAAVRPGRRVARSRSARRSSATRRALRPGARRAGRRAGRARVRLALADAVGYAHRTERRVTDPSASGLRRRRRRPRAAVRRHRPARAAAGDVGAARRRRRAWRGSPTPSSTRWPARSPCSSRSRRSSSGTARAGIAVLEDAVPRARAAGALVLLDVKRGDIGSTMAAYARLPAPRPPAGGRRDDGQPVPRPRLAAAGRRHRARARRRPVRAGPHLQPRRRHAPARGRWADAVGRPGRSSTPCAAGTPPAGWSATRCPTSPPCATSRAGSGRRRAPSAWWSGATLRDARRRPRRPGRPGARARAWAPRAARRPTCAGCSAPAGPSSPRCPGTCSPPDPTRPRCGRRRWPATPAEPRPAVAGRSSRRDRAGRGLTGRVGVARAAACRLTGVSSAVATAMPSRNRSDGPPDLRGSRSVTADVDARERGRQRLAIRAEPRDQRICRELGWP